MTIQAGGGGTSGYGSSPTTNTSTNTGTGIPWYKEQTSYWTQPLGSQGAYSNPTLPTYYGYGGYQQGTLPTIFPTQYTTFNYQTPKSTTPSSSTTYILDPMEAVAWGAPGMAAETGKAPLWYNDILERDTKTNSKTNTNNTTNSPYAITPSDKTKNTGVVGHLAVIPEFNQVSLRGLAALPTTRSYSI